MPRSPEHLATTIQRHGSVALKRDNTDPFLSTPRSDSGDAFNTDEWDPARGAFWQHAVAGSIAGVAEHSIMFPVDTLKTHIQVHRATPMSLFELISSCGVPRLWRGVQTMFAGCIPAHAAYFSIYETWKPIFTEGLRNTLVANTVDKIAGTAEGSTSEAVGAGVAVTAATFCHDVCQLVSIHRCLGLIPSLLPPCLPCLLT